RARGGFVTVPGTGTKALLRAQVVLEVGSHRAELPQGPRLELAHPLAGDAESGTDLFERPRRRAVEAEAKAEDVLHARVEVRERFLHLGRAEPLGRRRMRLVGLRVLDQVAVEALAVADRRLEAHRILDEIE